jgi:hypothetical protein
MPYRYAHWFVLGLLVWAGYTFWPSYLSKLPAASIEMHIHGVSAFMWMLLLAVQSWSIHHKHRQAHRIVGFASFAVFPVVLAGMALLDVAMAQRFAAQVHPFYIDYGARFGASDVIAGLGMAYLFFMALKQRKNVRLHAGYMLMTIVFLMSIVISRSLPNLINLLPGIDYELPTSIAVRIANIVLLCLLLTLRLYAAGNGRPMGDAAIFIGLQLLMWETVGRWSVWEHWFALFAQFNSLLMAAVGFLVGVGVVITGWRAGLHKRNARG